MKAFPTWTDNMAHQGMELRDYFAAKAMQGLLAHTGVVYGKTANVDDFAGAIRAYAIADAMMKVRGS